MQEQGRRLAALCTILNPSLAQLGEDWKVTPGHLVDLKHGRYQIGDHVAGLFQKHLGVSAAWLQHNDGKIFMAGHSPGKIVEDAIDRQVRLGTPGTGGAPIFDSVDEVRLKESSGGTWKSHALRGVMPVAASDRRGFYVTITDKKDAKIAGCACDDFVLFIRADTFLRQRKFDDGDELACILQDGSDRWLARFNLIGSLTARQRQLGLGFGAPGPEEYDIKHKIKRRPKRGKGATPPDDKDYDMKHSGKYKTEFYLKQIAPRGEPRIGELIAVAVRAERDLL